MTESHSQNSVSNSTGKPPQLLNIIMNIFFVANGTILTLKSYRIINYITLAFK